MAITDLFRRALTGELRLARGRVAEIEHDGRVRVHIGEERGQGIACDVLRVGMGDVPSLESGQEVLVALSAEPDPAGVILGGIGLAEGATPARPAPRATPAPGEPLRLEHREIMIEAGDEITLKCGEASITITRDGKIVIRGEHILSRAKGTQRIKGGSVAIN